MPWEDKGWLHPGATSSLSGQSSSAFSDLHHLLGEAIKPEGWGQGTAKPGALGAALQVPQKFTFLRQGLSSSPEPTGASDIAADKEPFYLEPRTVGFANEVKLSPGELQLKHFMAQHQPPPV